MFTTREYAEAALTAVLDEANRVAAELQLPEDLPITKSSLREAVISPFAYKYIYKQIGSVTTQKYCYFISAGNKFSALSLPHYDQTCIELRKHLLPLTQMNTNEPYQLATQWLSRVSVDVQALNRECRSHVTVSAFWNGLANLGERPKGKMFVPIYFVWWASPQNESAGRGSVAYVELFAPAKKLLQLTVYDERYILRKPLVIPNLNSLCPGVGTVYTNRPSGKALGRGRPR